VMLSPCRTKCTGMEAVITIPVWRRETKVRWYAVESGREN